MEGWISHLKFTHEVQSKKLWLLTDLCAETSGWTCQNYSITFLKSKIFFPDTFWNLATKFSFIGAHSFSKSSYWSESYCSFICEAIILRDAAMYWIIKLDCISKYRYLPNKKTKAYIFREIDKWKFGSSFSDLLIGTMNLGRYSGIVTIWKTYPSFLSYLNQIEVLIYH